MGKQSKDKSLMFVFIVILIIILFGIVLGFYYSSLSGHHPQKNKKSCESVGGNWSNEQEICFLSYKEAGELCTDGGQCISGLCFPPELTEVQKIEFKKGPLKNITGTCYPDNLIIGCVEQVIMGAVSKKSMCLDN